MINKALYFLTYSFTDNFCHLAFLCKLRSNVNNFILL
jgi:hypothetical protein